jgi:hypothetical protein
VVPAWSFVTGSCEARTPVPLLGFRTVLLAVVSCVKTNVTEGAEATTGFVAAAWVDVPVVPVLASGPVGVVAMAGLFPPPPELEPGPDPELGPPPVGPVAATKGVACGA